MADRDAVWRGLDTVLERSFTRRDATRYARPAGRPHGPRRARSGTFVAARRGPGRVPRAG
ncbi:hypothetical protein [Streptomyces shenzhenensis]|uniref:Uncharacterized protein n=1 Tax=Streptomyces shenzhenensis TaxID=943815 RepID=A0A3M0IDG2_9ACTN|nr:hypothetical protein [Streptomyces shenzhenensis]RMB86835.1 hypothetical protein CTZ28_07310 [Streptomyces shenzhenensis]